MNKFVVVSTQEEYEKEKKASNIVYLLEEKDFKELDFKLRAMDISMFSYEDIKSTLDWHTNRARKEPPYESKVSFDYKFVDLADVYKAVDAIKAIDIEVGINMEDIRISISIGRR